MNWLTNYVRPKIKSILQPKEIPENLWVKCPSCDKMIFSKELEQNHQVCPYCGHHFKLPVLQRLEMMFDDGAYTVISLPEVPDDPLNFTDLKKYSDRLRDARKKTKQTDAVLVAHGKIGGLPAVVGVFDFAFIGGSMGTYVGEAILAAVNLAILQEAALILVPASGGARMQEGILSLMQMARTTLAIEKLKEKKLPYIVLLTNPTAGGVTASFAMLGDVTLAEPKAIISFAGARVIQQTIREKLPDDFQTAEYLYNHGMIDMIVERTQIYPTLKKILSLLRVPKIQP